MSGPSGAPSTSQTVPNNHPSSHSQSQQIPHIGRQFQVPPTGAIPLNITAAMQQQQRQFMAHWANNLHREGLNRQAAHSQRMRTAANTGNQQPPIPGVYTGMPAFNAPSMGAETVRGRSSPSLQPGVTRTIVREGVSPNGTRWRLVNHQAAPVETNLRLSGTTSLASQEMQHLLRGADIGAGAHSAANSMQRSASSTSLPSGLPPYLTGNPRISGSRPLSRAATPDPSRAPALINLLQSDPTFPAQLQQTPEIYLLQSPEGPRALLFNGSTNAYYTSTMPPHPISPFPPSATDPSHQIPVSAGPPQPQQASYGGVAAAAQGARQRRNRRREPREANVPRQQQNGARRRRGRNPRAEVERAVMIARVWENVWLLARLGLFIWWFTSPDTSWIRWLALVGMALAIFVINTRILEGVGEQVWGPIRRHFENLLPLGDGAGHGEPAVQRPAPPGSEGQNANRNNQAAAEPQPAHMAARLIEHQRQMNENWLHNQVRRVERASLLFLASLAPGIAERHIRNFEQVQRRMERERERQETVRNDAAENTAGQENSPTQEISANQAQQNTGPENEERQSAGVGAVANASRETRQQNNGEQDPVNPQEVVV